MRSLDGRGDDPGGRAREPTELLDELRLRLARLPVGHPSGGEAPWRGREQAQGSRSGADAETDSASGRKVGGPSADPGRTRDIRDGSGAAVSPGTGEARDASGTEAGRDAAIDGESAEDDGRFAVDAEPEGGGDPAVDAEPGSGGNADDGDSDVPSVSGKAGRAPWSPDRVAGGGWPVQGTAEAYRPWFMTGEFGVPWFADESPGAAD